MFSHTSPTHIFIKLVFITLGLSSRTEFCHFCSGLWCLTFQEFTSLLSASSSHASPELQIHRVFQQHTWRWQQLNLRSCANNPSFLKGADFTARWDVLPGCAQPRAGDSLSGSPPVPPYLRLSYYFLILRVKICFFMWYTMFRHCSDEQQGNALWKKILMWVEQQLFQDLLSVSGFCCYLREAMQKVPLCNAEP